MLQKNRLFYRQYQQGKLNIQEFLDFTLAPLSRIEPDTLTQLHQEFMREEIIPLITPASHDLITQHRKAGDYLLMITATNNFITAPIAKYLGMDDIIATRAQIQNGRYTGKVEGIPSFQQGKVIRLEHWLIDHPQYSLKHSWFYSDSFNDLPLLEQVTHPVAVDPDEQLAQIAFQRNWPVISLKGEKIKEAKQKILPT